jgi:transcriptional regulator with XRE-family HTH domain
MTQILSDTLEDRIAERLRGQRASLGWSLAELADRSGVSKAMLARVERGEANPTAALLGRVCRGLGITLTALMAAAEHADTTLWRAADQPVWADPGTGLTRQVVGTPIAAGGAEIARLTLPAGTVVSYDVAPLRALHQHLLMEAGMLRYGIGDRSFDLAAGDCLAVRVDRPTRFEVLGDQPAHYLVVIAGAGW